MVPKGLVFGEGSGFELTFVGVLLILLLRLCPLIVWDTT
jgi:hypothetical protein